jgi:hypothetical protein
VGSSKDADLFRLWGNFFSPVGNPQKKINISLSWAPFFTIKLLENDNFMWANKFLNSSAWRFFQEEEISQDCLPFSIPFKCPKSKAICCSTNL